MISLVLWVCVIGTGACWQVVTPLDSGLGLTGCVTTSASVVAQYEEANPGRRVEHWGCVVGKPRDEGEG